MNTLVMARSLLSTTEQQTTGVRDVLLFTPAHNRAKMLAIGIIHPCTDESSH